MSLNLEMVNSEMRLGEELYEMYFDMKDYCDEYKYDIGNYLDIDLWTKFFKRSIIMKDIRQNIKLRTKRNKYKYHLIRTYELEEDNRIKYDWIMNNREPLTVLYNKLSNDCFDAVDYSFYCDFIYEYS